MMVLHEKEGYSYLYNNLPHKILHGYCYAPGRNQRALLKIRSTMYTSSLLPEMGGIMDTSLDSCSMIPLLLLHLLLELFYSLWPQNFLPCIALPINLLFFFHPVLLSELWSPRCAVFCAWLIFHSLCLPQGWCLRTSATSWHFRSFRCLQTTAAEHRI